MGIYLNPGNDEYIKAVNSKIYVDKTGILSAVNGYLDTEHRNICLENQLQQI